MDYGKNLARLRINANMSQEELASHLFVLCQKGRTTNAVRGMTRCKKWRPCFVLRRGALFQLRKKLPDELFNVHSRKLRNRAGTAPQNINRFLKTLSERDSSIFMQRYYFMKTFAEISRRYDLNEVYTRVILSRTRKKLKHYLESKGQS